MQPKTTPPPSPAALQIFREPINRWQPLRAEYPQSIRMNSTCPRCPTRSYCVARTRLELREAGEQTRGNEVEKTVRHCGLVGSTPTWDGTGCEFDSWQCRIYIPCSLSLRLLGSLRGSLDTYGLTQKLC